LLSSSCEDLTESFGVEDPYLVFFCCLKEEALGDCATFLFKEIVNVFDSTFGVVCGPLRSSSTALTGFVAFSSKVK